MSAEGYDVRVLRRRGGTAGYLALFASAGTLVCCALPSLLVVLGFGASVASLLSAAPWLVAVSRAKGWVFLATGLLLAGGAYYVFRVAPRLVTGGASCPPEEAEACRRATRLGRVLLGISAGVYTAGFVLAFLLGPALGWLDRRGTG